MAALNEPAPPLVIGVFTVLLVLGFVVSATLLARTTLSFVTHRRTVPTLLLRDLVFFLTLVCVVAGNTVWSFLGVPSNLRPLWWVLLAGGLTVVGTWSFAYWELRRMANGHDERVGTAEHKALSSQIAEGTLASREAEKAANKTQVKIHDLNEHLIEHSKTLESQGKSLLEQAESLASMAERIGAQERRP